MSLMPSFQASKCFCLVVEAALNGVINAVSDTVKQKQRTICQTERRGLFGYSQSASNDSNDAMQLVHESDYLIFSKQLKKLPLQSQHTSNKKMRGVSLKNLSR